MDEDDDHRNGDTRPELHSNGGSIFDYRMTTGYQESEGSYDDYDEYEPDHPPPISSPSAASSPEPNALSSLRQNLSRATLQDDQSSTKSYSTRLTLAQRLSDLAHQLADEDEVDEEALTAQVDELERTLAAGAAPTKVRRKASSRSDQDDEPDSSLNSRDPRPARGDEGHSSKQRLTIRQAQDIIAEANTLDSELSTTLTNLRARQEESDHIHALLVSRAERAAQRIISLQTQASDLEAQNAHLEEELRENDEELQNLRICLKAVEIQLPPHLDLDPEVQRCIRRFREEWRRVRRRRAGKEFKQGREGEKVNDGEDVAEKGGREGSLMRSSERGGDDEL